MTLRGTRRKEIPPASSPYAKHGREWPIAVRWFSAEASDRDGNKGETWANTYYKDFEPRFGFAWSPNFNTVTSWSVAIMAFIMDRWWTPTTVRERRGLHRHNLFTADPMNGPHRRRTSPTSHDTEPRSHSIEWARCRLCRQPSGGQPWCIPGPSKSRSSFQPDLFFSLGYLGQHAIRLHGLLNYPNDMPLSGLARATAFSAVAPCPKDLARRHPTPTSLHSRPDLGISEPLQALRPFPQFGYINADSYLQNVGQSSYNALEAKLERRFHNGLNLLASYTFSKTITDADSIQPFYSTLQSQGGTQNPFDHKAEKAVSNQDVPQNFVVSYLYELPLGHGKRFLASTPEGG